MKISRLNLVLLCILLAGIAWITVLNLTPVPVDLYVEGTGTLFLFEVDDGFPLTAQRWNPNDSPPPVSPKDVAQLREAILQRIQIENPGYSWDPGRVHLVPYGTSNNAWFYTVEFNSNKSIGMGCFCDDFCVVVSMDRKVHVSSDWQIANASVSEALSRLGFELASTKRY